MQRRLRIILGLTALIAATEGFLRVYYGLCDAVLMREDPHYEYIAQPSQDRVRFRRHIRYNSLSMRSEEPDSTALIIIGCGDSVINGGVLTDQDSIATTLLSRDLSREMGRTVQFLNVSAASWGPDNCLAYLEHTAVPNTQAIVLFVSSHDAHDSMTFARVVGVDRIYPAEQSATAIGELVSRYILPRIWPPSSEPDSAPVVEGGVRGFNRGFAGLKAFALRAGVPLVVYLHAERSEVVEGRYSALGAEIIRFTQEQGVHLIKDLDHWVSRDMLRDRIHPNERGQRRIADIIMADMTAHGAAFGLDP